MRQKTQNLFLKFSINLSVKISREKLQTNIWKIESKLLEKFKHSNGPQNILVKSFAVQLQFTVHIFSRTAVLRKLFDTEFSHKHCNFSHVCLLVEMASKTVTRSIGCYVPQTCSLRYRGISPMKLNIVASLSPLRGKSFLS